MDYRHTEAFAREMEAAALRAKELRGEAIADFWSAVGRGVRRAAHRLAARCRRALSGSPLARG